MTDELAQAAGGAAMNELDQRFIDAIREMTAEIRERFPSSPEANIPTETHEDAFVTGISFALHLLLASGQLFELDEERRPIPIGPEGAAPDPGYDRLCEIVVETWEMRRREALDEFLRRLGTSRDAE
jgi:hypothetical protein